jgi:hypothetical protein
LRFFYSEIKIKNKKEKEKEKEKERESLVLAADLFLHFVVYDRAFDPIGPQRPSD